MITIKMRLLAHFFVFQTAQMDSPLSTTESITTYIAADFDLTATA